MVGDVKHCTPYSKKKSAFKEMILCVKMLKSGFGVKLRLVSLIDI